MGAVRGRDWEKREGRARGRDGRETEEIGLFKDVF